MSSIDDSDLQVRLPYFQKLMYKQNATPLTHYEMQVAQNIDKIREYNEMFESFSVMSLVTSIKDKVSLRDTLFLLIDAYDMDVPENAVEVLESVRDQDLTLTTAALVEIFTESLDGMVPHLMIDILGDIPEEKTPPPTRLPFSLNTEAMRNFK